MPLDRITYISPVIGRSKRGPSTPSGPSEATIGLGHAFRRDRFPVGVGHDQMLVQRPWRPRMLTDRSLDLYRDSNPADVGPPSAPLKTLARADPTALGAVCIPTCLVPLQR